MPNQGPEQEVGHTQGKKDQSKENASAAGRLEVRLLETPPSQEDEPRGGGAVLPRDCLGSGPQP